MLQEVEHTHTLHVCRQQCVSLCQTETAVLPRSMRIRGNDSAAVPVSKRLRHQPLQARDCGEHHRRLQAAEASLILKKHPPATGAFTTSNSSKHVHAAQPM